MRITGVRVQNMGRWAFVLPTSGWGTTQTGTENNDSIQIDHNSIYQAGDPKTELDGGGFATTGATSTSLWFDANDIETSYYCADLTPSSADVSVKITNNKCFSPLTGGGGGIGNIIVEGSSSATAPTAHDVMISGNTLITNGATGWMGIVVEGSGNANNMQVANKDIKVIGNHVEGWGDGIKIMSYLGPLDNVLVEGNTSKNNTEYGIFLAAPNAQGSVTGTISSVEISHNLCYDDQTTQTQAYGFALEPQSGAIQQAVIHDNYFAGNKTGAITLVSLNSSFSQQAVFRSNVTTSTGAADTNTVAFSSTPNFDPTMGQTQVITLTGNVTSSTISQWNAPGQRLTFVICQDSTGGHTFAWPTTFGTSIGTKGNGAIGTTASKCNAQSFVLENGAYYATGPIQTNM